jgi:hypothetical protein
MAFGGGFYTGGDQSHALTNAATYLIQTLSFHNKNHGNKSVLKNFKRVIFVTESLAV